MVIPVDEPDDILPKVSPATVIANGEGTEGELPEVTLSTKNCDVLPDTVTFALARKAAAPVALLGPELTKKPAG
jgi:hypothetical protein